MTDDDAAGAPPEDDGWYPEPTDDDAPPDEAGPEGDTVSGRSLVEYDWRDPEVLVIGAALLGGAEAVQQMDVIGSDFTRYPRAGLVWDTLLERTASRLLIDFPWALETFPGDLELIAMCGSEVVAWQGYAPHWAGLVAQRAARAAVRDHLQPLLEHLDGAPLSDVAEALRQAAEAVEVKEPKRALAYTRTLVRERLDDPGDAGVQYETPWRAINGIIGGFRPGGLYIVGARPGVGKSAIALQAAHALAQTGRVALSTLEMSKREVTNRLIAQQCQIPYAVLSTPGKQPSDFMLDRMAVFAATDPGLIAVDDISKRTVHDVRQHARDVAREGPLRGVVLDYLQLLSGTGGRNVSRQEQVSDMSRSLKILAAELEVPVIALSQLNRGAAKGSAPGISDLRESGAIEQDADVVLLLHRDRDSPTPDDSMHVSVAKNRQGEERPCRLQWQGEFVRAMDY